MGFGVIRMLLYARSWRAIAAALAVICCLLPPACSSHRKPIPPEQALETFELPEGFRIELAAAEPNVVDPVAMAFDEQGRLLVVEMSDYPLDAEPRGQVKRLEDRDGDGYFEQAEVFADGLSMPTGVMSWGAGILVTAAPDILYFEDSDQDGRADVRKVVLTGFAATNPQLRVNGLLYGIDNWIYAAYPRVPTPVRYAREFGDPGGPLRFPDHAETAAVEIHSQDVRFRPGDALVEPVAGNSQFGNTFDGWGNRFTVWNNDHVRHVVLDDRYLRRNPLLANPSQMYSASDHENAAALYPITIEPEYIHDSQHGRFTSSCGISAYAGGSFPAGYEASTFVCDPVHNIVHRDVLTADRLIDTGALYKGIRLGEEPFLGEDHYSWAVRVMEIRASGLYWNLRAAARSMGVPTRRLEAHRARNDVILCHHLLEKILESQAASPGQARGKL